jgi:acetyl-CoA acetyltransferase
MRFASTCLPPRTRPQHCCDDRLVTDYPERRAIIAGIGISRIGRRSGIPGIDLTVEASAAAIEDAGLAPSDIDGITTLGATPIAEAAGALGIEPRYTGGGMGAGGLLAPVMDACRAVGERRARHVLVYRTVQMMGGAIIPASGSPESAGAPPEPGPTPDNAPLRNPMGDMGPLLAAHAYSAVNFLAMHCQRHMYLYGTTKEQLGWLAVNSRRNAALNPLAVYRAPMTLEDYLEARPVSDPLGLYDCDVPVDGSIAVVVSANDYAEDCPATPIRVEAMGGAPNASGWIDRPDYPKMASADAAAEMWNRTDLRPADVDIAELYDGFTFLTFAWLEALGFCGDGEAGAFVEGAARIALDGDLPLNTYGGQLSAGRMHGYWVLHEACLQLRGQAGARQVAHRPEVAVVSNGGGPIAGCLLVTR